MTDVWATIWLNIQPNDNLLQNVQFEKLIPVQSFEYKAPVQLSSKKMVRETKWNYISSSWKKFSLR